MGGTLGWEMDIMQDVNVVDVMEDVGIGNFTNVLMFKRSTLGGKFTTNMDTMEG